MNPKISKTFWNRPRLAIRTWVYNGENPLYSHDWGKCLSLLFAFTGLKCISPGPSALTFAFMLPVYTIFCTYHATDRNFFFPQQLAILYFSVPTIRSLWRPHWRLMLPDQALYLVQLCPFLGISQSDFSCRTPVQPCFLYQHSICSRSRFSYFPPPDQWSLIYPKKLYFCICGCPSPMQLSFALFEY